MERLIKFLKDNIILQSLSIFLGVSFGCGFFIINKFLAQYGFWDYTFLRVAYVAAGILFLVIGSITLSLILICEKIFTVLNEYHKAKHPCWWKKIGLRIFKIVLLFILFVLNYVFFSLVIQVSGANANIFLPFLSSVWLVIVYLMYNTCKECYLGIKSASSIKWLDSLWSWFMGWSKNFRIVYIPLFVFIIFGLFASFIYPLAPKYFGGGRALKINLIFTPTSTLARMSSTTLIYQTPEILLIDSPKGTFLINQDQVASIQYIERNLPFKKMLDELRK
jgi:hypothetical protein